MGIAHELITRGWAQGASVAEDGKVCLLGAAAYANGWKGENGFWAMPTEMTRALNQLCGMAFTVWNDDPKRTFDEVLRVAKEADEILDAS